MLLCCHCKFREVCNVASSLDGIKYTQMVTSWINTIRSVGYTLLNYEKTQEEHHLVLKWKMTH